MPTLQELLLRSSRTFGVGITALPRPVRDELTIAYLLLRVSDHLEDSPELDDNHKVTLLNRWHRVLGRLDDPGGLLRELSCAPDDTPDALVARNAATVLDGLTRLAPLSRGLVVHRVRQTTAGMARWVRRGPDFGTEADLDDYMHEVAGRVGYLITELFALHVPAIRQKRDPMMALGREFGLALQTVNVIRGLHEDHRRGWLYVPRSYLPRPDMEAADILRAANHEAGMRVLRRLVDKAGRHLRSASGYVHQIPRRHHGLRVFCILPLLFAVRTLALSRQNAGVWRREVKMTRPEVRAITRWTMTFGYSNQWMDWYRRRLGAGAAAP